MSNRYQPIVPRDHSRKTQQDHDRNSSDINPDNLKGKEENRETQYPHHRYHLCGEYNSLSQKASWNMICAAATLLTGYCRNDWFHYITGRPILLAGIIQICYLTIFMSLYTSTQKIQSADRIEGLDTLASSL